MEDVYQCKYLNKVYPSDFGVYARSENETTQPRVIHAALLHTSGPNVCL